MIKVIFFLFLAIVSFSFTNAQTLTAKVYSWDNAPPWANSELLTDTTKVNYSIREIDSVEFRIIRGYKRFYPDERGPDYLEIIFNTDKNGNVIIDLSKLKEGDLFILLAKKDKYIPINKSFKYHKNLDFTKWIAYMIPLRHFDNHK